MEELLEYERNVFTWINGTHTPFLDGVMWAFSGILIWFPLILVPLFFYIRRNANRLPATLAIVLVVVLCSVVAAFFFKPLFSRFRPTTHPLYVDQVKLLKNYTANGLYGFISGHTTTAFGFAMLTSLLIRNRYYIIAIFVWAVLMAYSRIYLGAHFVSDVWAGLLTGILLGWLVYLLYKWALKRYFHQNNPAN